MFPFHRSCELSFQIPNDLETTTTNNNNNTYYVQKVEPHVSTSTTPHPHHPPLPPHRHRLSIGSQNTRKGRSRRSLLSTNSTELNDVHNNNDEVGISGNDTAKKRTIHREIERHRRQEMSNLYSSLRSLLPMEYIQGKRSMCDHITEAARYIKDLEKNVKELGDNRDKLKGSSSSSSSTPRSRSDFSVSIHKFSRTIEIDIGVGLGEEDVFPLSRVLELLIVEGFNVVSSVTSRVNQRWFYVIHCEANDVTSIDSHYLQRKLTNEIGTYDL